MYTSDELGYLLIDMFELFQLCATLGSTGACSFDNLEELGPICEYSTTTTLHLNNRTLANSMECFNVNSMFGMLSKDWMLDNILNKSNPSSFKPAPLTPATLHGFGISRADIQCV